MRGFINIPADIQPKLWLIIKLLQSWRVDRINCDPLPGHMNTDDTISRYRATLWCKADGKISLLASDGYSFASPISLAIPFGAWNAELHGTCLFQIEPPLALNTCFFFFTIFGSTLILIIGEHGFNNSTRRQLNTANSGQRIINSIIAKTWQRDGQHFVAIILPATFKGIL